MYKVTIYLNKKIVETKTFEKIIDAAKFIDKYRKDVSDQVYSKIEDIKDDK